MTQTPCTHSSDKMFQKNASKFSMLYVSKNHVVVLFVVHFVQLYFFPYESSDLCQHKEKSKVGRNEQQTKQLHGFLIHKA